jgi:hypothetical protein
MGRSGRPKGIPIPGSRGGDLGVGVVDQLSPAGNMNDLTRDP